MFSKIFYTMILTIALINPAAVRAENVADKNAQMVNRRVLILDFLNLNNSADYQYLETSIPDTLQDPLSKTKSFELMNRSIWQDMLNEKSFEKKDAYNEKKAIEVGKLNQSDVVVIGSFAVDKGSIMISSRAIEISSGRVIVSRSKLLNLDNSIFTGIGELTSEMSAEMKEKLPPLPQQVITIEREKYITVTKEAGAMQAAENISFGGEIWRTLAVPGWGHVYAGQWRGWIYMPLWIGSAGTLVTSIILLNDIYPQYAAAFEASGSNAQSLYDSYSTYANMRKISAYVLMASYLIPFVDILISGNSYALKPQKTMSQIQTGIEVSPDYVASQRDIKQKESVSDSLLVSLSVTRRY